MALTEIHLTAQLFRSSFNLPVKLIQMQAEKNKTKKGKHHSHSPKECLSAIMMTVTQSNMPLSVCIQPSRAAYDFLAKGSSAGNIYN